MALNSHLVSSEKYMKILGTFVLIIFLAVSFFIRKADFRDTTGVQNLEATYHALLTVKALKESPVKNHWLLPSVSLGQKSDKYIRWGATIPTKTGDYIYTSFTPPGFIAPFVVFDTFHIQVSIKNLARFNFVLGSLTSLILFALLLKMLAASGCSSSVAVIGAVLGTLISIFSKEVLQSHGIVYWIHSFYQLILVSNLYFLWEYLSKVSDQGRKNSKFALLVPIFVFLGALTEWTGYIYGMGLATLLWFGAFIERPQKRMAIHLVLALVAAGLFTIVHYGMAVGFEPTLNAFVRRFLARNTASGSLLTLMDGYVLSFGLFLVVAFVFASMLYFLESGSMAKSNEVRNKIAFLFVVSTIPLVENIVMLQHAGQFSFDRLKFIFPAAILIAFVYARLNNVFRFVLAISLLVASFHGYSSYRSDLGRYSAWKGVNYENKLLVNAIKASTDIQCSVLLSNIGVRGYANLLFNRGIFEYKKSIDDAQKLLNKTKSCSAVYLVGKHSFVDLQKYTKSIVLFPNGSGYSLSPLEIGYTPPLSAVLTDSHWKNGIALDEAGIAIPNTESLKTQLSKKGDLIFRNGEVRKIRRVVVNKDFLQVYLEGEPLKAELIGPSNEYILRSPYNITK